MNKDQVKGSMRDAAGKAQEKLGKATGSKENRAKGAGRQVEGKTQKKAGDLEQAADKITRKP